jgi:hypothetical protein
MQHGLTATHHIEKFDETTVMMLLSFQGKKSKMQGGLSWWSFRPTIIRRMELRASGAMTDWLHQTGRNT